MKKKPNWFDVDRDGLAKLVADKPKVFILHELLQNAWDQNVTLVEVFTEYFRSSRTATIKVLDDDPEGFKDLSHAYTLFAESKKKSDASKRGRFNLGEKLVLALCSDASIQTTKGSVGFRADGRVESNGHLKSGSLFSGAVKMTVAEFDQMMVDVQMCLPTVKTVINGVELPIREPLAKFTTKLATEIGDDDGVLRRSVRSTAVRVYEVNDGEQPHLYEMGIPVVPIDCRWHIEVMQKIPLNMNRDNVTPAYAAKVITEVVNHMITEISEEDASTSWVGEALGHEDVKHDAVAKIMDLRFGAERVSFDPTDLEANQSAVSSGYKVIHGATLNKKQWSNVRAANAIVSAGIKFETPKPFSPNGKPLKTINPDDYTTEQCEMVDFIKWLSHELVGRHVRVTLADDRGWGFSGAYGREDSSMTLNVLRLGSTMNTRIYRVVLHELAHERSDSHLDKEFYEALNEFAVKVTQLAIRYPENFKFLLE